MTAPAEKSHAGEKHSGGLAQVVRWLTEERPVTTGDDGVIAGAPRRVTRWTYGDPPARRASVETEIEVLAEVRIGPAPRCAVAGETIALSVSLINSRGDIYLGWPIKLEWASSDPSIATVNEFGVVDVHTRGRVELTCTCEGKSGSVLLTVVEPAVAIAVGLPVPARLRTLPAATPRFEAPAARQPVFVPFDAPDVDAPDVDAPAPVAPAPATDRVANFLDAQAIDASDAVAAEASGTRDARPVERAATPARHVLTSEVATAPALAIPALPAEPPAIYRRSTERGSVRHAALALLPLSRGARRVLFRVAVGTATAAIVGIVLTRSPEEVFVVDVESPIDGGSPARSSAPSRQAVARAELRSGVSIPASIGLPAAPSLPLGETAGRSAVSADAGRVVSEAAGSAVVAPGASEPGAPVVTQPAPTPITPPPAPAIARVVVASSPSQLTEGESVRLSAAGVDDRGSAVADRGVTWKSENEDIAVVDPDGVVTAKRPGTVTIVATSEGRSGRVTLSVGARPPAAPARENNAAAAIQVIRARVDEFVTALRERNGSRVASLYNAESAQDRKNLQALLERLRRPEARLKASDPALATPEIREMEAAVDFQISMSWTTPFGRVRSQTSAFRAVLEPGDGGWRLVAIRALGKID